MSAASLATLFAATGSRRLKWSATPEAGRALIDAVAQWARDRGRDILELDVYGSNEPAYRACLKSGFTVVGPCAG
jgi:GNAT superfamily N-acetyltransferase